MDTTLIITDLDGTLLSTDKKVGEKTRQAIRELKNRGILFGIASGRPVESGEILCHEWGLDDSISFLVGMNGGAMLDRRTGQKEEYAHVDGDVILEIINHFKVLPDLHFEVMVGNDRYVEWSTPETLENAKIFGENEIIVNFDEFLPGRKVNKLVIRSKEEDQPKVIERAKSYSNPTVASFPTSEILYEYVDPAINKGYGLAKVIEHYGLSPENIIAFGDQANDIEMLKEAGLGVAMKNASAVAKEAADVILDYTNDEDGIGHYILETVLQDNPDRLEQPQ